MVSHFKGIFCSLMRSFILKRFLEMKGILDLSSKSLGVNRAFHFKGIFVGERGLWP